MAEAVAGETGKPFVFVDPGAFNNMFFGVGILKVKGLFRKLRRLALRYGGVIVFFDEADSLGSRSMSMPGQAGGVYGANGLERTGSTTEGGVQRLRPPVPISRQSVAALSAPPGEADPLDRGRSRYVMPTNAGGGGMGTLQALLTELTGLKKPRGFFNRFLRRALLMQPKPPPKYRILIMMATNLPEALDPALRRPGRIDREYRVGYPSKEGRLRTFEGYLCKVQHELTPEQVDKLATITAYATGAKIKDMVNEALVYAIREGHDTITWKDMINAKHLKDLGPLGERRVHRARAARRRGPRGLPRGDGVEDASPHGDRRRDDRQGQHLPRHGVEHPARGPVHAVAQRVRERHPRQPRLAGR